jgi:hypothetical protein
MRHTIAFPLALGIALAAPISAYAALNDYGTVHHSRAIHHRSLAMRAQAPAAVTIFAPAWSRASSAKETDGLSRNPDDCAAYGCIDNGGD